jgi:hypothetical protein
MIRLYRASNNAEADVIVSLLTSHDIPAVVQGYQHRSLLGFLGPYIQLNVLVSEGDEAEARRLMNELKIEATDRLPAGISPRRAAVAIMLALLYPGLGSLYLGRRQLGGWLLTGTAVCLATMIFGIHAAPFPHMTYAGLGWVVLMACDVTSTLAFRYSRKPKLTVLSDAPR